jgi:hypothetical protein
MISHTYILYYFLSNIDLNLFLISEEEFIILLQSDTLAAGEKKIYNAFLGIFDEYG